jgi:hypothetical protein
MALAGLFSHRSPEPVHESPPQRTRALGQFLASLQAHPRPVLLDLGPVVGSNLTFFGEELGCKILVEDLYRDIDRHVREGRLAELPAFLAGRFAHCLEGVDGILCWDVFDYLDRPSAQALAGALVALLRPDGVLLALFTTSEPRPETPPAYTRHVVVDRGSLQPHNYAGAQGKQRPLMNRDIQRLFAPLCVTCQFLLATHTRELLFRKAAAGA